MKDVNKVRVESFIMTLIFNLAFYALRNLFKKLKNPREYLARGKSAKLFLISWQQEDRKLYFSANLKLSELHVSINETSQDWNPRPHSTLDWDLLFGLVCYLLSTIVSSGLFLRVWAWVHFLIAFSSFF